MRLRAGSLISAGLLLASHAAACSCATAGNSCPNAPTARTVVLATVISKESSRRLPPIAVGNPGEARRTARPVGERPAPEPWGSVVVTLKVSERFKGDVGDSLIVRTEDEAPSCGYPFQVGGEYLVFAEELAAGGLSTTSCSATRPAKMAAALLKQLRIVRDSSPLPDLFGVATTHAAVPGPQGWEQIRPVPGVTVIVRSAQREYVTQTAEDGLYEFAAIPRGEYNITLEAPPGRAARWGNGTNTTRAFIWPGNPCPLDFEVYDQSP